VDPWLVEEREALDEETPGEASPAGGGATPLAGSFRGEVLAVLGDAVESSQIIAAGARLDGVPGRAGALAARALSVLVPDFAARSRELRGGFLVAGEEFAAGGPCAAAALCLAESRVKAVLARSFAGQAAQMLVHAGVLPLVLSGDDEAGGLEQGDEIELPGMPEALMPAHPLLARNLTRGTQHALRHGLSARGIAILRAGGLVPFVVDRPRPAEGR
jgi:aconitate hydratase